MACRRGRKTGSLCASAYALNTSASAPIRQGVKAISLDLPASYYEKIGSEAIAFLKLPAALAAVRVGREQAVALQREQAVRVSFPVARLKFFDAGTGRRL